MTFHKNMYSLQNKVFDFVTVISYILIFVSLLGYSNAPKFLSSLDYYLRIYICLFLIWRFRPFQERIQFTELDRKISFTAGVLILTTTVLKNYLIYVKDRVHNIEKPDTLPYNF